MMHLTANHLTDDQLIARLYGVEDAAVRTHLSVCSECVERYEAAERRRSLLTGFRPLTPAQFAQQRAAIAARIESRPPAATLLRRAWAPAMAAALLIGAGLYFSKPSAPPVVAPEPSATVDTIDANWYQEVYSHIELVEPRAAGPIRELFQEESATE